MHFLFFFSSLAADYFDLQPSWFDTLLNNVGCLEIKNNPVTARDLEANKADGSNSKLAETVKGTEHYVQMRCNPHLFLTTRHPNQESLEKWIQIVIHIFFSLTAAFSD